VLIKKENGPPFEVFDLKNTIDAPTRSCRIAKSGGA
jgi:hypothetical protein